MSKSIKLAGREGSVYGKVTAFMRKKQVYTREDIMGFLKGLGLQEKAANATATVMLSPRLSSTRGDCRGNLSNPWGHQAYNAKLNRVVKDGIKEAQKYRFMYRKEPLEKGKREEKVTIKPVKVKSKAEVNTPVKAEVAATDANTAKV